MALVTNPKERKGLPITTGVLDYFPDAIAAVAEVSRIGNDQHNPGQPLHWAKEKSTDHADCITRHLLDRGMFDTDGVRHSAKVAWRALALLQTEIEQAQKIPADKGWEDCAKPVDTSKYFSKELLEVARANTFPENRILAKTIQDLMRDSYDPYEAAKRALGYSVPDATGNSR